MSNQLKFIDLFCGVGGFHQAFLRINKDENKLLIADLNKKIAQVKLGGGKSKLEKIRSQGKMPARERISCLLDKNSDFIEIGALAGYEMYKDDGGCPSGGVVVVMGYISKNFALSLQMMRL